MGQAVRTTKLFLDLSKREEVGDRSWQASVPGGDRQGADAGTCFLYGLFPRHAEKLAERSRTTRKNIRRCVSAPSARTNYSPGRKRAL